MKACVNDMNKEIQQYKMEIDALKCEMRTWSDYGQKIESEKLDLQKQYDKLLEEVSFLRGQVQAFTYCLNNYRKGGN